MDEFNAKYKTRLKKVSIWNIHEEGHRSEKPFEYYTRVGEEKFLRVLEESERVFYFQDMFLCMLVSVYGIPIDAGGDRDDMETQYQIFKNVYNCDAKKYETEHVKKNLKPVQENNAWPDWMYRI